MNKVAKHCLWVIGVLSLFTVVYDGNDYARIEAVGAFIASGLFTIADSIESVVDKYLSSPKNVKINLEDKKEEK